MNATDDRRESGIGGGGLENGSADDRANASVGVSRYCGVVGHDFENGCCVVDGCFAPANSKSSESAIFVSCGPWPSCRVVEVVTAHDTTSALLSVSKYDKGAYVAIRENQVKVIVTLQCSQNGSEDAVL